MTCLAFGAAEGRRLDRETCRRNFLVAVIAHAIFASRDPVERRADRGIAVGLAFGHGERDIGLVRLDRLILPVVVGVDRNLSAGLALGNPTIRVRALDFEPAAKLLRLLRFSCSSEMRCVGPRVVLLLIADQVA